MARSPRSPSSRRLSARGERLDHAIEIVAFGDEEGVRFRTTLTGSRALAGTYPKAALDQKDAGGVAMRDALKAFGGDPERAHAIRRDNVAAFVEAHIEQGPFLRPKACRSGSLRPSTARPGSRSAWTAWPDMPGRRRCACAATR